MTLVELTATTAIRGVVAGLTFGTIRGGITYYKTKSISAALDQGLRTAALTGFAFVSPAFAYSMLSILPLDIANAIYDGDLGSMTAETALYVATSVGLSYLFKTHLLKPNPATISGILRDASRTFHGNTGVGAATAAEAVAAGRAWVGPGFRSATGKPWIWISGDGLRQFRLPRFKPGEGKWLRWTPLSRPKNVDPSLLPRQALVALASR